MYSNMVFSSDKATETPLSQGGPVWTILEPSWNHQGTIKEPSRNHLNPFWTISRWDKLQREHVAPVVIRTPHQHVRWKSCSFHLPSKIKMCQRKSNREQVPTTIWKHPILKDLTDGNILIKMAIRPFGSFTIRTFRLPCDLTSWAKTVLTSFGESGGWKVWEASLWPGGHWFKHQISKDWEGKGWTQSGGKEADRGSAPPPTLANNATVGPLSKALTPLKCSLGAGCWLPWGLACSMCMCVCVHVWWDECRDIISFKVGKVSTFAPTIGPPAGRNRHGAK